MSELTTAPPRYHVAMGYLHGLFDYLRLRSVPLAPLLEALALTPEAIPDKDRLLPAEALDLAFETAARLTGDPLLGFHAGCHMSPAHLGIVGHLLLCCATPAELVNLLSRYGPLIGNGIQVSHEIEGEHLLLRIRLLRNASRYPRHVMDFHFTGWLTLCRWLGGPDLAPDFIELRHAEAVNYRPMRDYFNCEMRFDCAQYCIGFTPRLLQRVFTTGDSGIKPMLEAALSQRLQRLQNREPSLDPRLARLRQLIAERLKKHAPELREIADATGDSVRRLQRYLEGHATSFKQLVDEVRKEMAAQHLRDATLTLIDVALMLGFSDQSTFQRAFKRWYGVSPGAYRRLLSG